MKMKTNFYSYISNNDSVKSNKKNCEKKLNIHNEHSVRSNAIMKSFKLIIYFCFSQVVF